MAEERLYTDHPELYDAIQSGWNYDRDVEFVVDQLSRHGVDGRRLIEVGCGTGEHTRRFVKRGFAVTAVDAYGGMLSVARAKLGSDGGLGSGPDADLGSGSADGTVAFRRDALPGIEVDGRYDAAVAIRGVINHVSPDALAPAVRRFADALTEGGLVVFDNSPLPPDGNRPGLDVGETADGRYARVARHAPRADGRLDWRSVTFTADGEPFVSSRPMTPFADETIRDALVAAGFDVETTDGYGPEDDRTVFVGVAPG